MGIIHEPTGTCLYCGEPMTRNHPWHTDCWQKAQRKLNSPGPTDQEHNCEIMGCNYSATTYTKIGGIWYRVCGYHQDEGWSLDRSLGHVEQLLNDEPA